MIEILSRSPFGSQSQQITLLYQTKQRPHLKALSISFSIADRLKSFTAQVYQPF
jgi:hypothetical protein